MPSRAPRNRTAYSLLIGIILLASIGYVCGFVALWIRPETPTNAASPRPTSTSAVALQPTLTLGALPTQFVPPQATPTLQAAATKQTTPTLAASPTKIPATPTTTLPPTLPPLPTVTAIPLPTETLAPTLAPLPTDTAIAPTPTETATPGPVATPTAIP